MDLDKRAEESTPIGREEAWKVGLIAALLGVAAGVWYWTGRADRAQRQSAIEALKDVTYRVRCAACNQTFEMPAATYVSNLGLEGVKCIHCGQRKAWRIGDANDVDPAEFRAEVTKLASVDEVKAATDAARQELDQVEKALAQASQGDSAIAAELRRQRGRLQGKLMALDRRWDELTSKN